MTDLANSAASPRSRTIAYWVTTVIIAAELAVGGVWDILRIEYALSPGQGVGLRRCDLHLYRSSCLPPYGG